MASYALTSIQDNTHLPEVQRFLQKYYLKRTFNSGLINAVAYGSYKKSPQTKVLIKAIFKDKPFKLKEAAILKQLCQVPGVVKYLDHYAIKCTTYLLVTEYFGHMNLQLFLSTNGSVSEKIAHTIFYQLFTTVQACYNKNILHRKLKPSNILINVNTNQVKITNFNSASQFDSDEFTSQLNQTIAPPEYFKHKKYTVDGLYAWTLGLILYELLFNIKPFNCSNDVINTPFAVPPHQQILSLNVITLLDWMLTKNCDRITINQLNHHPWITKRWI